MTETPDVTPSKTPHPLLGELVENPGYHLHSFERGQIGEISKIVEEVSELIDAHEQDSKIMELVELSDLMGAVEAYLETHHTGVTLDDLIKMNDITRRAFRAGRRT